MKKLLFLLVALPIFMHAWAQQQPQSLTIEEAVSAAEKNNAAVQQAELDEKIAQARYRQSKAIYLPQVGISYTAVTTNNPLNAFGMKLQQKMITQNDFNPVLLNNPDATPDFSANLSLQQPLINLDMNYQRKAAGKQVEMYQMASVRTKEYLGFETRKAYLQLQLANDAVKVLEEANATAKAVFGSTENYFNQGMIQKSDLLNVKVYQGNIETQLSQAQLNVANAADYLSLLMGAKQGTVYQLSTPEITPAAAEIANSFPATRADFKAMEKGIESYDLMITATKKSYLPRLNAFANYQLNDNRMLGFGAGSYLAGVQLSWDIFKGNRVKESMAIQKLEKSKLQQKLQQEKDQSQLAINQSQRNLAQAKIQLQQQAVSVEQAEEALRVTRNRYAQGLITTNDVLMAQTQLSQQKLMKAQANFQAQLATISLQFFTATTK